MAEWVPEHPDCLRRPRLADAADALGRPGRVAEAFRRPLAEPQRLWACPVGATSRAETAPTVRGRLWLQRSKGVTGPDGTAAVGDWQPVQASGEEGEGLG